jgi:hypothetical protein
MGSVGPKGANIPKNGLAQEFGESGKKCYFKILNSQSTVLNSFSACTKIIRTKERKNF